MGIWENVKLIDLFIVFIPMPEFILIKSFLSCVLVVSDPITTIRAK